MMRRISPRESRLLGWAIAVLLPGALGGCEAQGEAGKAKETAEVPINVRALSIQRTDLPEYLTISGPLRPIHGTEVSTEEAGVVASVRRDKGSTVKKGEVIVELRRELLRAEMGAADADQALREYDIDRTRKLFEANQVSRFEMLTVETRHAEATARADMARVRYERAAIKAPFTGIVADRYVEPGELVAAGTPIGRIVNPYTLKLEASVSEREVGWIRKGAPAAVDLESATRSVPGIVHWTSFEANPANGKFQIEVRIDNPDLELRPGIVGRARVLKQNHEDVTVIPRDAIVLLPDGPTVFVIEGDRARARRVTLGADQGLIASVKEGLEEGERIVVRGQRDVLDGSLIKVQEVATSLDGSTGTDPDAIRAASAMEQVLSSPAEGADR